MEKYYIGIIDEDHYEVENIERTIIANKPEKIEEDQILFNEYPIPSINNAISTKLSEEVITNIIDGDIHVLIVDYKIMVESSLIDGTEIFQKISSEVPRFPIVMLTNVPDDCYKPPIDADKVYAKRSFFKIEESYSKEKTLNLFRNIENYKKQRAALTASLTEQLLKLDKQGYSPEIFQNIISLENTLDDYLPQAQSTVEKELNVSELRDAVNLLQEANQLLGDKNEN